MTNTTAKTMSTNSDDKKGTYKIGCYIFDSVLLAIILLLIICYYLYN